MADKWFTAHCGTLGRALSHVAAAVDDRSEIGILTHVMLSAAPEGLRLRSTNLDLQIDAECDLLECAQPISLAINSARLERMLKQLPESAEITFAPGRQQHQLSITSGISSYNLPLLPSSDFPDMRGRAVLCWHDVNGAALADALTRTAYAVSSAKDRIYLQGNCIHKTEDGAGLVVAATDGNVLACIPVPDAGGPPMPEREHTYPHIILPQRGMKSAIKLFKDAKHGARMAVTDAMAAFAYDGIEITTKLIDGVFPDYRRIIPSGEIRARVSREAFAGAVNRVCILVDGEKSEELRVRLRRDCLTIDLFGADTSVASDSVPAEVDAPENFAISHVPRQLQSTVANIRSADLDIFYRDNKTAAVIRPVSGVAEAFVVNFRIPRLHRGDWD